MNIVDIILKKRDGYKLSNEEIAFFVKGVTEGSLPDYQISAFLMAAFIKDMDTEETASLTMEMARSGSMFDFSQIEGFKADKHSTGGVADTTTLILAPLVASTGVPVIKMSGRGLGFSGGTIDKLESIPGFNVNVSEEEAIAFAKKSNIVLMSQTDNLTPADKKLYALRDVTGTVDSIPLIAASIMSKKIAAGADGIVLDVKCGSGAFMQDLESAETLASVMVNMGRHVGRKVTAVISGMDQPLGMNIGNSLEVIEAIEVLKGNVGGDLLDVSLTLGAHMLLLAERVETVEQGKYLLEHHIKNGMGLAMFRELLLQQGGNPEILNDYSLLPLSPCTKTVLAQKNGYINEMDTALIGRASLETGAGRAFKEQPLDFGAGIIMKKRLGDSVKIGEPLAEIFASSDEKCTSAANYLQQAMTIGEEKQPLPALILKIID
ncbi:thymidine phosphorylase [Anaerotignum sp. MB30-C6]|uniref:thymidine phosphorylase n=1 Tax=Anaerotignum sp. MB30-C6 TaxID=3070814 RepID=UPI0027DD3E79|nr:thymidine phosphorylase [Anaerotignum sp. MB30-C6]WMI80465.1 thymidine phosphorylase [Anaerotignum sp. MB30-C6]